ncbi:MAG: hypothetical protein MJ000_09535 [Bacteroidales bacterium]|nr:hypothetical protein [Bacteroidales bacterium]
MSKRTPTSINALASALPTSSINAICSMENLTFSIETSSRSMANAVLSEDSSSSSGLRMSDTSASLMNASVIPKHSSLKLKALIPAERYPMFPSIVRYGTRSPVCATTSLVFSQIFRFLFA